MRKRTALGCGFALLPTWVLLLTAANFGRIGIVVFLLGELAMLDSFLIGQVGGKLARVVGICLWTAVALCGPTTFVVAGRLASERNSMAGVVWVGYSVLGTLVLLELVACALFAGHVPGPWKRDQTRALAASRSLR